MANENDLKLRVSTGSAIMLWSLPLPFVIFQFREFARQGYLAFELAAMVLVVGYLLYCGEDFRAKRPFSVDMLTISIMTLILFAFLAPVFSSSK